MSYDGIILHMYGGVNNGIYDSVSYTTYDHHTINTRYTPFIINTSQPNTKGRFIKSLPASRNPKLGGLF